VLRLSDARYERRTRLDRLRMDRARHGERGRCVKTFHEGKVTLHAGDCLDVLKAMPENSIDAVVTDPPYHLIAPGSKTRSNLEQPTNKNLDGVNAGSFRRLAKGFMGKQWDGGDIAFRPELWTEVLRVLKPGGHLVCFGGTRTYHRMVSAIEDAGFEVRDQLAWVYGSGFPKSHDVSKGIDRAAGVEREIVAPPPYTRGRASQSYTDTRRVSYDYDPLPVTVPATDTARQWQGWGTALKPAFEPICLARKPLSEGTVAANVLRWGTGALNIDGCRIEASRSDIDAAAVPERSNLRMFVGDGAGRAATRFDMSKGRWPANLCHDGSAEVLAGFPNGESRYFYTSKANYDDRLNSKHPTVKPVDLMQWLVRLVCPKGATVLDPFAGTGTTGEATFREGCKAILIEREAEYLADIERRMELLLSGPDERARKLTKPDPHETLPRRT
jgi:DNA modification methylase